MDTIYNRVLEQLQNFVMAYNIRANRILIGHDEYREALADIKVFDYVNMNTDWKMTMFGVKVQRVHEQKHLSVGFVEEEIHISD